MKKDNIGGILTAIIALIAIYWFYQQSQTTGSAVSNLIGSVSSMLNGQGGSRTLTGLVPAALGTTPTYLNPVAGTIQPAIGSAPNQTQQQILANVLNAPVGTVAVPGGNNGDVMAAQIAIQRMPAFVM